MVLIKVFTDILSKVIHLRAARRASSPSDRSTAAQIYEQVLFSLLRITRAM